MIFANERCAQNQTTFSKNITKRIMTWLSNITLMNLKLIWSTATCHDTKKIFKELGVSYELELPISVYQL